MKLLRFLSILSLSLAILGGIADHASTATPKTYDFKVFLDDDEIGTQRFVVSSIGPQTKVQIDATFDVKLFFITAYTYRHSNNETWEGDCLREIRAKTDDNGETFFVQGTYRDGQLQLRTHNGEKSLKGCIRTFAYWNPDWFRSNRLLNSQTGEYDFVRVSSVGEESIPVRGVETRTVHYRIVSDKFTIDLWYDLTQEWVALQSTTESGDILYYKIQ